jgi:predicted tellurium resistance membrane protein TerC
MFDWITQPEAWIALGTLTALEIVLGIDNIIFIAILVAKLPEHQRKKARQLGLAMAMLTRLGLLTSLALLARLTDPWLTLFGHELSGRDFVLIIGGFFLLAKSTMELHEKLEGGGDDEFNVKAKPKLLNIIVQIMFLDIVFSLDSVITAVGMVNNIPIMATAIIIAVLVMLFFSGMISDFIERHPTVKILALSFLLMIGLALMAEGFDFTIPKAYIYTAMAFSVFVEMMNIRFRKVQNAPVHLRNPYEDPDTPKDSAP